MSPLRLTKLKVKLTGASVLLGLSQDPRSSSSVAVAHATRLVIYGKDTFGHADSFNAVVSSHEFSSEMLQAEKYVVGEIS